MPFDADKAEKAQKLIAAAKKAIDKAYKDIVDANTEVSRTAAAFCKAVADVDFDGVTARPNVVAIERANGEFAAAVVDQGRRQAAMADACDTLRDGYIKLSKAMG